LIFSTHLNQIDPSIEYAIQYARTYYHRFCMRTTASSIVISNVELADQTPQQFTSEMLKQLNKLMDRKYSKISRRKYA